MKKIMLIDDVEISNFIMKKMIEKVSGNYEVHAYLFSAKALDDLDKINPDLIFLDINMPEINGWDFLEIMKENNSKLPVYILTSSTSELDLQKSQNYDNVKNFLIKPIKSHALQTLLHDL